MFGKNLPLRTLAAVLTALLLVGGIQASASAATSRSLSVAVSSTGVAVRGGVNFSGRLTKSPRGTVVSIQRKIGSRWVTARTTRTTSAAGAYSVVVTMPATVGTYAFRASAAKTRSLRAATSRTVNVAALTQAFVSLTASPISLTAGNNSALAGAVYPFVKNTVITIQRKVGAAWTTVTTTPLSANGTFDKPVTVLISTDFRVSVPRVGSYSPAISREQVVVAKPAIATGSLPAGTRFATYSTTLAAVGGIAGTWTASPLPAGLALNAGTGVISGTPTAAGDTSVVIGFTQNGGPAAASKTLNLHVNQAAAPVISTTSLPNGTRLSAYTTTLTATGNPAGTWTASPLPAGLNLDPSTGVISGTPTALGDTNVVVGFTETANGLSATPKTLGLHVNQATAPVITTASLPATDVGSAYGPVQLTVTTSGNPAGTWDASPLPAGLSIDHATGIISGTVALGAVSKNVKITFNQTSTGLDAAPVTLFLRVGNSNAPVIATTSLPDGTRTSAYTASLTAAGGATGTWTASPLPAGVTIDTSTGVISGTPSAVGNTDVVIGFTQTSAGPGNGQAAAPKTLTLHVNEAPAPVISTSSLPVATRLAPYTTTLTTVGNVSGTWTAAPLPAGLSLNASTGVISGTPTGTGPTDVLIGFTQSAPNGLTAQSKTLTLTVNQAPAPVISTGSLPDGTRGTAYTTTLTATGNPPGTWSATPLPAGLTLDQSTGVISGTPTTVGDTSVVIGFTQTDSGLAAAPKTLTLHVNEASPPVIATAALPNANRFRAYSTQLTAVSSPAGTWSTSALPAGLSLDPSSGVISGTPTSAGDTAVTINFTQTSTGLAATSKTLVLHVNQDTPVIATTALPDGAFAQPYTFQMQTVGSPVGTWTLSPTSNLPIGMGFHPDGTLNGTPLQGGNFVIKVTFKETSTGLTSAEASFNLHIG